MAAKAEHLAVRAKRQKVKVAADAAAEAAGFQAGGPPARPALLSRANHFDHKISYQSLIR